MGATALILGQDLCHTGIFEFYKTIAEYLKCEITEETHFNCNKLSVTKGIQDEIFDYYREKGSSEAEIGALWMQLGPKASLKATSSGGLTFNYMVIADEGFVSEEDEEEEDAFTYGRRRR